MHGPFGLVIEIVGEVCSERNVVTRILHVADASDGTCSKVMVDEVPAATSASMIWNLKICFTYVSGCISIFS